MADEAGTDKDGCEPSAQSSLVANLINDKHLANAVCDEVRQTLRKYIDLASHGAKQWLDLLEEEEILRERLLKKEQALAELEVENQMLRQRVVIIEADVESWTRCHDEWQKKQQATDSATRPEPS